MRKNIISIVVLLSIVLLQGCLRVSQVKPTDCYIMKFTNHSEKIMIYYVEQVNHKFSAPWNTVNRAVGELGPYGSLSICLGPNVFIVKWKEQGKAEPWLKEVKSFTLDKDKTFVYP